MLRRLSIRDLAIIDLLELELSAGFTVITGETGAGKSILVDALDLIAGGRADSQIVRPGAKRTEVSAEFDVALIAPAAQWLAEQELDEGSECLLRRTVRAEGGSRCWINGRSATVQQLRTLSELLLEIHGQHEHQALLSRSHQRELLDAYGHHRAQLAPVREAAKSLAELRAELAQGLANPETLEEQEELLRMQVDELLQLQPEPARLAELDEEQRRLSHAEGLLAGLAQIEQWLDGDEPRSARSLLLQSEQELSRLAAIDAQLEPLVGVVEGARLQIEEVARDARDRVESGDLDPQKLEQVETALSALHTQARRHRVLLSELPDVLTDLKERHRQVNKRIARAADYDAEHAQLMQMYAKAAVALSKARTASGKALAHTVQALMAELGMPAGQFAVELSPRDADQASADGAEQIEFLVSANPGLAPRPLRKVASGGELARIGLAIKVATVDIDDVPVLVFDEVDSGIGGATAEIVGRKMRSLGRRRQVLAVTHLPQVAASAHHHLMASKLTDDGATVSALSVLDPVQREREIARMLTGVDLTDRSLAHAEELLSRAAEVD